MAFAEGCTAWADSEITPCLLSIINKRHCGQLLSKFCCGKELLLAGCHRSICQSSRGKPVSLEWFFFQMSFFSWPFEHQQQISSHILWIRVTAEGSAAAVFIPNTWWSIAFTNVKMLTLSYFDPEMVCKLNCAIIWHQNQQGNGQLAEPFMH